MKSITSKDMLDLLYGRKLPQVYRDEDSKLGFPLKRYLESLIEGGYYGNIEDIKGMLSLIDPMAIPEEFFPYLCESVGLTYFPDMDVSYQRKFLANLGELNKRRGTFASVHFLVRALTGLNSELSCKDNILYIVLLAKNIEQLDKIETSMAIIKNFISFQIPHYINSVISSRIDTQVINSKSYSHSAVSYYRFYSINQNKGG